MTQIAFTVPRLFDGHAWRLNATLLIEDGHVAGFGAPRPGVAPIRLDGQLVPGLIDLQVNGGGGALLGPETDVEQLALICAVHARFGVTALLPTLITDTPEVTDRVLAAGAEATRRGVPGFLGLHLEGPHLAMSRKGAHDPALIRPMDEADLVRLERARPLLPNLMVTVAPEVVTPEQIARMARAGIFVSIGHSDASFATATAAIAAGARNATHLFNAMSQMGNREPGLAGAALHHGALHAGVIADGIHIHPATLGAALRAKTGPGRLYLVSDSMSQAGTDATSFLLNGRTIHRRDGALRLDDGTLAGADLTMDAAVRYLTGSLGLTLEEALRMATLYPAEAIGAADIGRLTVGARADFVLLDTALNVLGTWIGGQRVV